MTPPLSRKTLKIFQNHYVKNGVTRAMAREHTACVNKLLVVEWNPLQRKNPRRRTSGALLNTLFNRGR